jgi:hypothetical protein
MDVSMGELPGKAAALLELFRTAPFARHGDRPRFDQASHAPRGHGIVGDLAGLAGA